MSPPVEPATFVLDVVTTAGIPLRVVAYAPGATGPYPAAADPDNSVVEFYDRRYPHTEHGQFTGGRYFAASLMQDRPTGALILYGGVADWQVDADTFGLVDAWLWGLPAIGRRSVDYHAPDCAGPAQCDGCGWIDSQLRWRPGPCPPEDQPHQAERSEGRP